MKKNAFTLVELIATIAILAIIVLVTAPNIINVFNSSKESLTNSQKIAIEKAARNWGLSNVTNNEGEVTPSYVTVKQLQASGYLNNQNIENEDLDLNSKVCITWQNNQFNYTYGGEC